MDKLSTNNALVDDIKSLIELTKKRISKYQQLFDSTVLDYWSKNKQ